MSRGANLHISWWGLRCLGGHRGRAAGDGDSITNPAPNCSTHTKCAHEQEFRYKQLLDMTQTDPSAEGTSLVPDVYKGSWKPTQLIPCPGSVSRGSRACANPEVPVKCSQGSCTSHREMPSTQKERSFLGGVPLTGQRVHPPLFPLRPRTQPF